MQKEKELQSYTSYIEIDFDAMAYNLALLRTRIKESKICAVVKANAYGHGIVSSSKFLEENNITYLAVAYLTEAVKLRENNIKTPILILGGGIPLQAGEIIKYDLTQTVATYEMAEFLSKSASQKNKKAKVHIKIDTGMGRLGFFPEDAISAVKRIIDLPGLEIEGIYTHFSIAGDLDKTYTFRQMKRFTKTIEKLEKIGIFFKYKHVANTATVIDLPDYKLDMVRTGAFIFGLYPSSYMKEKIILKPAMSIKSKIVSIKTFSKRSSISYGRKYYAKKGETIAVIPIGYADAIPRELANRLKIIYNGRVLPVVGRICMDQMMFDVSEVVKEGIIPKIGDIVTLIGSDCNSVISIDDWAKMSKTVNYELISNLSGRLPRVYLKNGEICDILD